jgi:hypothetical protein
MRRPSAASTLLALSLVAAAATPAAAQLPDRIERQAGRTGYVNLTGPRAGVLVLAGDEDRLREKYDVDRVVAQLGIAFERRMFAVPEGPTGVAQLVALAGIGDGGGTGAQFVPSGMLLFGLRTQGGFELSVGPWFAEKDAAAVVQLGAVLPAGYMRIPFHVQLMPTGDGLRVGFTTGFNALR